MTTTVARVTSSRTTPKAKCSSTPSTTRKTPPASVVLSGLSGSRSLLAYLNLRGLIAVGERAGLAANPGYRALAPEIHRLEALGISVASAPDDLETSVRLLVGG